MATISVEGRQLKIVQGSNIVTIPIDDVIVDSTSDGVLFKQNNAPVSQLTRSEITSPTSTSIEDLINQIGVLINKVEGIDNTIYVNTKTDLPTAIDSVITLEDNVTYYFTSDVDLTGDRLVGGSDTVILGASSENSSITSTGLGVGVALLTTEYTTPVRHITFKDVDTALAIDGNSRTVALDWTGVNFLNVPNVGVVNTCDNFIFTKGAFLNSQGFRFTGTVGTIAFNQSIFVGNGSAGKIFELDASATVTRRFRIIYSSIVVFGSTVGIDVNTSATIPIEGYILDTVNFSGGGTYTTGVDYLDNKVRFSNSKGIINTSEFANYYMTNNATATTISSSNTAYKIQGTTTASSINQKFSHTNNRITYTGEIIRDFEVSANASFTTGNNQVIGLYVAKNGVVLSESEMYATTSGSGRAESITVQTVVQLEKDDYIELWIENESAATDITVEYLNVIAKSLN